MNKDEILMKSQMENKGRDLPGIVAGKDAATFAIVFGVVFMLIIAFLCIVAGSKMVYGVVATEFCISFGLNLFIAVKQKKTKYTLMAVSSAIPFAIFTFITVCEIFKVYP